MPAAVAVAASGGRDSTALLHCTLRAAATAGLRVLALHVHHGLMPQADAWQAHVRVQCRRWARAGWPVAFASRRLQGQPAAGDSIEAWARRERYKALAEMAHEAGCTLVLLAHHRRDQAETLLLQALRGGGPAGLAAMPRLALRDGITWARPWLDQPREAVQAYLVRHRLRAMDDDSNADPALPRRGRRQAVWPTLQRAFPDVETQLPAAARRAAEAAACLREQVEHDLSTTCDGEQLVTTAWADLSPPRRQQLLRAWLRRVGQGAAPESLVQRLANELPAARVGQWPAPGATLQLYRGRLAAVPAGHATAEARPTKETLDLRQPGHHALPPWGSLLVTEVPAGGVALHRLGEVAVRSRSGAEQFQRAARSAPRSLKKQFQSAAVPAWQRSVPLLFDGEQLLFVPGLGLDARCLAAAGEPQVSLTWEPAG